MFPVPVILAVTESGYESGTESAVPGTKAEWEREMVLGIATGTNAKIAEKDLVVMASSVPGAVWHRR